MDETVVRRMRERLAVARKAKADMLRAERKAIRAAGGSTIGAIDDQWPPWMVALRYPARAIINTDPK